jgi:hypothetical protein
MNRVGQRKSMAMGGQQAADGLPWDANFFFQAEISYSHFNGGIALFDGVIVDLVV